MPDRPLTNIQKRSLTRREFMLLSSMTAAGLMFGCATDPVTGKSQFMLVSEDTKNSNRQAVLTDSVFQ